MKKDIVKTILGGAAFIGATTIVGSLAWACTDSMNTNPIVKGLCLVGSVGLGWAAGQVSQEAVEEFVDNTSAVISVI